MGTWTPRIATEDDVAGDDFVVEDVAVGVDVAEEFVERLDALGEAGFDDGPFGAGDDAGEQIVGDDALHPFVSAGAGEGDALVEKGLIGGVFAAAKFGEGEFLQAVVEGLELFARGRGAGEHFVVGIAERVVLEWGRERHWGKEPR